MTRETTVKGTKGVESWRIDRIVILGAAKDIIMDHRRFFAAIRMTVTCIILFRHGETTNKSTLPNRNGQTNYVDFSRQSLALRTIASVALIGRPS